MAFPGVTLTLVRTQFAARVGLPPDCLAPEYATLVQDCVTRATADVRTLMGAQGYRPADLANWDDGGTYLEALALYYALSSAFVLKDFPQLKDTALDPRPMLKDLAFVICGGEPTPPSGTSPVGGISGGDSTAAQRVAARYDRRNGGCW